MIGSMKGRQASGRRPESDRRPIAQVFGNLLSNRGPVPGHSVPIRTAVKNIRHKLCADADSPTYIFNRPRVGYLMPRSETQE